MADNKKISTRLVLRNDDLSAWNSSTVELLKGEAALARLSGDLSGFYEVRIGTGDKTWSQLGGSNIRIPAKNVEGLEQTITSLSTSFNYVGSVDALNALAATANNGDFAVVSSEIADGKVSYTAYRFNSELTAWQALDGNYDASNVYFNDNMTITYNFGKYTIPSTGSTVLSCKGKSIAELINDAYAETKNPSKPTPSTSVKLTAKDVEVGTSVTPTFTASFDPKTYTYGSTSNKNANSTTNASLKKYTVKYTYNNKDYELTGTSTTLTGTSIVVENGVAITGGKISAEYNAAADGTYIPLNNIGGQYPAARVTSGTATATDGSNQIQGYYPWYYGYKTATTKIDVTALSFATLSSLTKQKPKPSQIACDGMQQIFIARSKSGTTGTPAGISNSVNGAPLTMVGPVEVTFKDAANRDVAYEVWYVNNDAADSGKNTYEIS